MIFKKYNINNFYFIILILLLFELVIKINFSEKIHLNFTFNDYADNVLKLLVFNESNQTIHSSLDFSSKFEHYKLKKF